MNRPVPVNDIRKSEEHGVEVFACMKWSGIRNTACVREQTTAGRFRKSWETRGFRVVIGTKRLARAFKRKWAFLPVTQVQAVRNGEIHHDFHSGADQHPPFLRSGSETEKPAVVAAWRLVSVERPHPVAARTDLCAQLLIRTTTAHRTKTGETSCPAICPTRSPAFWRTTLGLHGSALTN
jgi:hypothetical protein